MNAQDAYKTAYEANTNTINSQYSEIQKKIIDTAKKGEYTIYWYEYILPDVKKKLQSEGYVIGSTTDVRNDVSVEISWAKAMNM